MLQDVHVQFRHGCMMLFHREGRELAFTGTAFLISEKGYLLTAAHLLYAQDNLMVCTEGSLEDFGETGRERVESMPVDVVTLDRDRDVALLKIVDPPPITVPQHLLSPPDETMIGGTVATLGYPFGYHHIYDQVLQHAIISARITAQNGTRLLLFDSQIHPGARGGPLINVDDLRILGVVSGRFDPAEASPDWHETDAKIATNLSYAIAIDEVFPMLEAEGIDAT